MGTEGDIMWKATIVQGTEAEIAGHRIGVIDSGVDTSGRGGARLGVRCGEEVDRFSFFVGEERVLPDGWSIRLDDVRMPADRTRVPVVGLVLSAPVEPDV